MTNNQCMNFSELAIGQDFHFPECSTESYCKISSNQALLNSPYSWHIADIKPKSQVCPTEYNRPTSCPIWEKKFLTHIEQLEVEYGFFEY
ncbi:MAG: hypothetical protein RMY64_19420 [Nostoc sp. DedQUE08]|nr:hypothetical protein [Nostoc sp. DedQUE08]